MKKKLISILFLTAILFVSCSNENKTGPSSCLGAIDIARFLVKIK